MRFFNVTALLFPKFKNELYSAILVGAAMIALSGCSDKMFTPPQPVTEATIETLKLSVLSRNLIETRYKPTSSPNRYDAQIKWPSYDGSIKFFDEKKVSLSEEAIKSNEFFIEGLEGGVERTFILETQSKDKTLRTQIELILLPPKDLVLGQSLSADQDLNVTAGRVFISDNVTIFTNDHCLSFEFNELIVGNNVKIYNFDPNAKAVTEKNGRNGGCLKLKGKIAKGFIKLFSNSEQGGDGVPGFPRCLGTHAAEVFHDCFGTNGGHSGMRGSFLLELENSSNFDFDFKILDITGGSRGEKNPSLNPHDRTTICLAFKGDGRQRYLTCDIESIKGNAAAGGKMCFKLKTGVDYECIEKN